MRRLFYMGLESYESRYTLQLTEWNRRVFDRRGLDVVYVPGSTIDDTQSISVGQVLDALLRNLHESQNLQDRLYHQAKRLQVLHVQIHLNLTELREEDLYDLLDEQT